jgi:hypothetical protein
MNTVLRIFLTVACTVSAVPGEARATDSPHGSMKLECTVCHTTESWTALRDDLEFDHAATGFRLDGSHSAIKCGSCHRELIFGHTGTACADCHPDHHLGQLGSICDDCHTPTDWHPRQDLLLQHAERGFPLTGVHAVADCQACHRGSDRNEFIGTSTECIECHREDLARAEDPRHTESLFRGDCQLCHHAAFGTWTQTTYEHPGSFPLIGAHRPLDCVSCHANGFEGTPKTCLGCHELDYRGAADPDHIAGGFGTTCETCHSVSAWRPAMYDHNLTGFPLTGAHFGVNCISCHANGYVGTPTLCVACHQTDYDNSTNPDHVAASFPTGCETCHSTSAWVPSDYDHNLTGFPLTGKHFTLSCSACHAAVYVGTPALCVACHQSTYDNTSDPDHLAANFPTECESCHTTSGWRPSTWDHDGQYFPIYSGAHSGKWSDCTECHTVPANYGTFECILCHEHNQTDMDAKHSDEQGYVYLSIECYRCHPQGKH